MALNYLLVLSVLTAISAFVIVNFSDASTQKHQDIKNDIDLLRDWKLWLGLTLMQMSFGTFYNFFTIYETDFGISLDMTVYLWSFGVLCEIVLFYYQGNLLKRNLLLLLQFAITTAIIRWMLLWLYPDSIWVAYLSQSLHAFSFALYYTAIISYVYNLYEQKRLAQQFLLGLSFGLGGSVGAFIAGVIYDYDKSMLFGVEAFVAFLSLWALYIHANRRRYIDASV
jgi:PPP family 3-phenylpropionic acid transporter